MCHEPTAHNVALNAFLAADAADVAAKAGANFINQGKAISIQYFSQEHVVDIVTGEVADSSGQQVSITDATLILQYLAQGSGLPPRGKWLSFLELPQGENHYAPFIIEACNPLARAYENDPADLRERLLSFGGQKIQMGDDAFCLTAFTKLPLAVVLWEGDDEFPTKAVILYDSVAPLQLPTAALWVLGIELTKKLVPVD